MRHNRGDLIAAVLSRDGSSRRTAVNRERTHTCMHMHVLPAGTYMQENSIHHEAAYFGMSYRLVPECSCRD